MSQDVRFQQSLDDLLRLSVAGNPNALNSTLKRLEAGDRPSAAAADQAWRQVIDDCFRQPSRVDSVQLEILECLGNPPDSLAREASERLAIALSRGEPDAAWQVEALVRTKLPLDRRVVDPAVDSCLRQAVEPYQHNAMEIIAQAARVGVRPSAAAGHEAWDRLADRVLRGDVRAYRVMTVLDDADVRPNCDSHRLQQAVPIMIRALAHGDHDAAEALRSLRHQCVNLNSPQASAEANELVAGLADLQREDVYRHARGVRRLIDLNITPALKTVVDTLQNAVHNAAEHIGSGSRHVSDAFADVLGTLAQLRPRLDEGTVASLRERAGELRASGRDTHAGLAAVLVQRFPVLAQASQPEGGLVPEARPARGLRP